MDRKIENQRTFEIHNDYDDHLLVWIQAFLTERRSQNLTPGTIAFYRSKLGIFAHYCETRAITRITQITPDEIRSFIFGLENSGHNSGGIHCFYRVIKTFLRWWEFETEPEGWKNPILKVKGPKLPQEVLEPVSIEDVNRLLDTCRGHTFRDLRDRAIFLTLLDTGLRASELVSTDYDDYDQITGEMIIRNGKGRKPRSAFVSKPTRRAIRAYCRKMPMSKALWVIPNGERLTYWGLDMIMRRRSKAAGITKPLLHGFRRAYALAMLRAGVDVYSLSKLMGHADLQVLTRYLKQTNEDLRLAHEKGSPVNNSGIR